MAMLATTSPVEEADEELSTIQLGYLLTAIVLAGWQLLTVGACLYLCCYGTQARTRSREGERAPCTSSSPNDINRASTEVTRVRHKKTETSNKIQELNDRTGRTTKSSSARIMDEMYARAAPVLEDMRRGQEEAEHRRATEEPWESYRFDIHGTRFSRSSRTPRNLPSRTL